MNDIDVKKIRKNLNISQDKLAEMIGVSLRTIQNYEMGGVIPKSKHAILHSIETGEISADGNISTINYEHRGIPYYNVDFICGFDIITNDQTINPEYYIDFKQYNNADYWINASGDSMRPVIAPGDIIAIRQLPKSEWQNHILYGEIYAIVTTQNRTIKKIRKSKLSDDYIRLIPENLVEFDEQDIPKQDITHVFQVLGCMKRLM